MPQFDYDLFVIGAGSGGVRAARMAAGFGARVAIAEQKYLGGTCVNAGCVPKKLFVYASHFAEDFEIARSFGWKIGSAAFCWSRLVENKDAEIKRLNGIYQQILDTAGVTIHTGRASISDAYTVKINEKPYTAERILIATGGWPYVPGFPGSEYAITSNEAFHLDALPRRIIIVGGGYIAVEFACIFHGLGVHTSLVYRGPLFLRGFDQDLRTVLAGAMRNKGIELLFDTNVASIEKTGEGFLTRFTSGDSRESDAVMFATGRKPKTSGIGLEETGVKLDHKCAIVVNDQYQTSVPSIYAIGDVTDRVNLTPVALAEGMVLATSLYGSKTKELDYNNIPTCVFSQPSLGTVGLTEEDARERYKEIVIYKSSFKPMKLSLMDSEEETFMKLIVEKTTDRVIGIHMVGPDAGETIQGMAIAMKAGATKTIFDSTIGIHPTAAEEFVTMREPFSG